MTMAADSLLNRMAALNARLTPIANRMGIPAWTLIFQASSQTIVTDPETGIEYAQTQPVIIQAHLMQSKDQSRSLEDREHPLINPSSIRVEGWCVDPYLLPDSIHPMSIAQASSEGITGQFLLLPQLSTQKTIYLHHLAGYLLLNPGA